MIYEEIALVCVIGFVILRLQTKLQNFIRDKILMR